MSRKITKEVTDCGERFQVSLCDKSVSETLRDLSKQIIASTSAKNRANLASLQNVLRELTVWQYMPLSEVYQEYLAKLPIEFHPQYKNKHDAVRDFVLKIVSKNVGLPVLIVNTSNTRFVLLWENCGDVNMASRFCLLDKSLPRMNVKRDNMTLLPI